MHRVSLPDNAHGLAFLRPVGTLSFQTHQCFSLSHRVCLADYHIDTSGCYIPCILYLDHHREVRYI